MEEFMGEGRGHAESVLRERLQLLADQNELGVEIIRIAVMDAHPPVEQVAPAYQEYVASIEQKDTEILRALAYWKTVVLAAEAEAFRIRTEARSRRENAAVVAQAESERFEQQLAAFRTMRSMFMLNARMEVWETEGLAARKFIVPAGLRDLVYQMNFEENERLDLGDIDVSDFSDNQ